MFNSIPPSMMEKFTTFGDFLRFLRRRAGFTQLELSIAVGYSDAQISRLEQNLRLPDLPTIEARFVPVLGIEDQPKVVSRLLELAATVRREDAPGLGVSPYKGLNYFDEQDADLFVGREVLVARLAQRVLSLLAGHPSDVERCLAIIGASGSGKSSLVRAGLVPALRWNKTSASWPIHIFTPTAHPLESLAASLTQDAGSMQKTAALIDDLAREPRSLSLFLNRRAQNPHLLVVDQFEELFALCRSDAERAAFIDNLLTAACDGPAVLIIALRADFYAFCAGYPRLRAALASEQEYIGAMSVAELRSAIEEPAARGRWELEPGLVDLLLRDVGDEPGALPLLSHALLETWQRRRGRMLTLSGYTASGGVRGAIAETAEAVFADRFSPAQQAIARRIFLRLVDPGDESALGDSSGDVARDTRRRATFDELILNPGETGETQAVLNALADARLIITGQDYAEVAHEALIREWPKLRGWLEENRDGLRLHRHLTETAREWAAQDRLPDNFYRGARLAQAREWAAAHSAEMNDLEREFLEASQAFAECEATERELQRQRELEAAQMLAEAEKQHATQQARTARQLRQRAIFLAGALILSLGLVIIALYFGSQARQAAAAAQAQQRIAFSRELAAAAISNLDADPERSILLAVQAVSVTYSVDKSWTSEAEDALHRALQTSRLEMTLRGHTGKVFGVAFSPDGTRLASSSDDGTARVWDAATGKTLFVLPTGNTHGYSGVAFSPDGTRLVTAGEAGTAKIWDAASGRQLLTLTGHHDWVTGGAFSPDGTRLAVSSEDRTAIIYDAATGQEQLTLRGHTANVYGVAFSPDGARVATASLDGSAWIWDAVTGKQQTSFSNISSPVIGIAFSPDGTRLATSSVDRKARLWDAATGRLLLTFHGHTSIVVYVAFSPDGSRLATASADGKAILWDASTGQELLALSGHTAEVASLAFSPDGSRLATSSFDGSVKVWNVGYSQELLTISFPGATAEAVSPDAAHLAVGFMDGSLKIWNISSAFRPADLAGAGAREMLSWSGHAGPVNGIAFSPDGLRLATSSEDQAVKLWDLATGQELLALHDFNAAVHPLVFSPDGTRLAAGGSNYEIKIWDLASSQVLVTLNPTGSVFALAFSPDGKRLVAGSTDGTVKVWNSASGNLQLAFQAHTLGIYGLSLDPDGSRLVSASDDGTAKVWDSASGQNLLTLNGNQGWVNAVAYSPDGTRLATSGQDGTVRLWDAMTGQPILALPGVNDPVTRAVFSPDGARLFAASLGTYRFYLLRMEDLLALARLRATRTFTTAECQQFLHRPLEQCPHNPATLPPPSPAPTSMIAQPEATSRQVCMLTDQRGVKDEFYNQVAYQGVLAAADKFRWRNTLVESLDPAGYAKNLNTLIQSGCDLIVAPTATMFTEIFKRIATANPDQKFLVMEVLADPPMENVRVEFYDSGQAAFLAGYLAASVTKTGAVGTFGGVSYPPVTAFMDGFALGVTYYNQVNGAHIRVLGWDPDRQDGLFIGDFDNTAAGRRMAEKLMDDGAGIILPVAGSAGLGAAVAVQAREDVYLIGVDSDWAETYPEYAGILLTSVLKRLDVSVLSAVGDIVAGSFTGGVHVGTLENGGVGLAPFHDLDPLVSPAVRAALEQIQSQIISGQIPTSR